ncbi:pirin family protein [Corynebacterium freneyi]|uniref:pirin family protein n=1 Tax=Corynebacterium freneyi TaxID=134034 RepID=UPI001CCCC738|nr:pirin family protein [Corynebacterium freneyi]UBI03011.1 pirin family protein [Corynebacterium freneyi]
MSSTRESGTARSDLDVSIIRAEDRSTWRDSALLSRQSFPATGSFDLEGNAFGLLMVHNDDVVAPGEGFDMHQHHDVELVTWVMEGHLRHRDDGGMEGSATGTESILSPGMAQRISAGRGIRHSELNASGYLDGKKLRVIQAWLPPDELGAAPSHDEVDLNDALAAAASAASPAERLIPVASGTPGAAPLTIGTSGATLRAGRIPAGTDFALPAARFTHFFVAAGSVEFNGTSLYDGDVARITSTASDSTDSPAAGATGDFRLSAIAVDDAEVLIWAMDRAIR